MTALRMNARLTILLAAAAPLAAFLAPLPAAALPSECDEACLVAMAETFLTAVGEHDASLIAWNAYGSWTMNGIELPFSEAIWALENEMSGAHRIIVPDVEAGEVGVITTWTFDATPALMAARLKVEFGRLSEAETVIVTQPAPSGPPGQQVAPPPGPQFAELGAVNPAFAQAASAPASPGDLIAAADAYFDAMEAGAGLPLTADCTRVENGAPAACANAMADGPFAPAIEASPRRYLADPATGVVFVIARYNDDGVASQRAPGSVLTAQVLKIEGGDVAAAEVVGERVFYMLPTGWGED